jgi:hypothetical protein
MALNKASLPVPSRAVRKETYFRRESSSGESGGAVFPRTEAVAAFHCAARHALYYTHHTEMHDTHTTHGTEPHYSTLPYSGITVAE